MITCEITGKKRDLEPIVRSLTKMLTSSGFELEENKPLYYQYCSASDKVSIMLSSNCDVVILKAIILESSRYYLDSYKMVKIKIDGNELLVFKSTRKRKANTTVEYSHKNKSNYMYSVELDDYATLEMYEERMLL